MALLAVCAAAASGFPRQTDSEEGPLQRLQDALQAYVALHDQVVQTLAPLEISPDAGKIQTAVEEMAAALRAARPSAQEGDIFNAEAAPVLRSRIRETLRECGYRVADMLAAERDEDLPVPRPQRPLVHDQFKWGSGSFMPGCVLDVLPSLPGSLQFRFVERDLVLVDVDASLVVDVLPDALLPATESWTAVRYVTSVTAKSDDSASRIGAVATPGK